MNDPLLVPSQSLPSGRVLYQHADDSVRHAVFRREEDPRLWLAHAAIPYPVRGAGPFEPCDALRAWRLSNVTVPYGCVLVPWESGIGLFAVGPTPGELYQWMQVDPAELEPSLSHYSAEHVADTERGSGMNYPPKIRWQEAHGARSSIERIWTKHPELRRARLGMLAREWNAHPAGSPVLMKGAVLESGFSVIDLPPPREAAPVPSAR